MLKAEEYYGRAILFSPGDGELLSLYGKLIWETQRDENRAKSYFNQALQASPNDWYVYMLSLSLSLIDWLLTILIIAVWFWVRMRIFYGKQRRKNAKMMKKWREK